MVDTKVVLRWFNLIVFICFILFFAFGYIAFLGERTILESTKVIFKLDNTALLLAVVLFGINSFYKNKYIAHTTIFAFALLAIHEITIKLGI